MKHVVIALVLALPLPALAQGVCPALPDRSAAVDRIYADLRFAPGPAEAQALSARLWDIWLDAPDKRAQRLLDQGMLLNRLGRRDAAREVLGTLIGYCPAYAEGYNQRAHAAFLAQDFSAALADLDRVLARRPRHLGALTGKALTLIAMGRVEDAQEPLRAALRLNRWLSERALLTGPMEEDA